MSTLVTGAFGRVGTALIDHATDTAGFTYLDTIDHPDIPCTVADIADYPSFAETVRGTDALIHLAAASRVDAAWPSVIQSNVIGAYNCFEAARRKEVETVVFASTNHVVGMYEQDHPPRCTNRTTTSNSTVTNRFARIRTTARRRCSARHSAGTTLRTTPIRNESTLSG